MANTRKAIRRARDKHRAKTVKPSRLKHREEHRKKTSGKLVKKSH